MLLKELEIALRAIYLLSSNLKNLYIVKAIESTKAAKLSNSFALAKVKPIAEPLASPTCMVSFRGVIFFYFRLIIQVGL